MAFQGFLWRTAACGIVLGTSFGCHRADRPPMGKVSGVVTLNGEPMPGVAVIFRPSAGGRQSTDRTDEAGTYTLHYFENEPGCAVGEHEVYLSTAIPEDEPGGPQPERVPAEYRGRGKLQAEVHAGRNEIDLKLGQPGETVSIRE